MYRKQASDHLFSHCLYNLCGKQLCKDTSMTLKETTAENAVHPPKPNVDNDVPVAVIRFSISENEMWTDTPILRLCHPVLSRVQAERSVHKFVLNYCAATKTVNPLYSYSIRDKTAKERLVMKPYLALFRAKNMPSPLSIFRL